MNAEYVAMIDALTKQAHQNAIALVICVGRDRILSKQCKSIIGGDHQCKIATVLVFCTLTS